MLRIQNILCPVDFFPASESAANYAIALAKKLSARLILLHVVEPVATWAYDIPYDTTDLIDTMTAQSTEELKKFAKRALVANVPVEVLVREGEVDLEIQTLVRKRNIDFVVMGTHGRRGLEKFFMGSTTERLLRKLNVPLLTIGNLKSKSNGPEVRHILVPTDFSAGTPDAMAYAIAFARQFRAKVTLLHVLNDVDADVSGRYQEQLMRSIQRDLEELLPQDLRSSSDITVRVETGRPIQRILPIINKEKVDLIVMNVHGKTLLDRMTIGSTAEKVVRGAGVPILVVPPAVTSKSGRRPSRKAA